MEAFEKILKEATAKGSSSIIAHGAVYAVIDKKGDYLYQKTSGFTSLADDAEPITMDSTFQIASCTKLVTSIAALQCVERGLITLDEPIDKYLPDLAKQPVCSLNAGEDNDTNPIKLTERKEKLTLRHLLTHSSGCVYDTMPVPEIQAWMQSTSTVSNEMEGDLFQVLDRPLIFEPGASFMYGTSIDWVGVLICRLNGKATLEEYFEQNIYAPLGLTSTTFWPDKKPSVKARLVSTVSRTQDGGLEPAAFSIKTTYPDKGGAGLYASVPDYMKILADVIADEPVLLSKTCNKLLFTPQFAAESGPLKGLYSFGAYLAGPAGGPVEDISINHTLGGAIFLDASPAGAPPGTIVWGGLPNLLWWANREVGVAALAAYSVVPSGDKKVTDLSVEFQKAFWKTVKVGRVV